MKGDEGRIALVDRLHLLDRDDDSAQEPLGGRKLKCGGALLTLEEELDSAEAALDLTDPRDDAHRVKDVGRRLVGVVALSDGEGEPFSLERRFDGAERARSACGDWRRETRKNDCSPQWENGKRLAVGH